MGNWIVQKPDSKNVARFVSVQSIQKLTLAFDIEELKDALWNILSNQSLMGDMRDNDFASLPMT